MEVLDNKCPSCGANVVFNPEGNNWYCKYCDIAYTKDAFKKYEKELKNEEKNNEIDEYQCKSCGARVVTDKNTIATSCVYCGSSAIIKNRIQNVFLPDGIIPFSTTKEDAINYYYNLVKKRWFVPNEFLKKENIEEIKGVYVPFWLYDCDASGRIVLKYVKAGDMYDKFSKYEYKTGYMSFKNVPVDGSIAFKDEMMDSIEPFEYDDVKEFNISYLSGFYAEKYDMTNKDVYARLKRRVSNTVVKTLLNIKNNAEIENYEKDTNICVSNIKSKYLLLPVWILNVKYKNQLYSYGINGQTGKTAGVFPVSAWKLFFKTIIVFLSCKLITFLLLNLF